jgi:iron uptake system component EfeO
MGVPAATVTLSLLAAACGSEQTSGGDAHGPGEGATSVRIALTDKGCRPQPGTVDAGSVTFDVTNSGTAKVSEAELRSEQIILGEHENLTPGISGEFTLRLEPGPYTVYCPNAAQDTWKFRVTGKASKRAPELRADLATATSGYHDYVVAQAGKLVDATDAFAAAVKAGNVAKAKRLYAPARFHYEEIEPAAESFGDLDPAIDARINDVSEATKWTGYHRIEKALWADESLAGAKHYARKLTSDVATLRRKTQDLQYQPAQLANGATELLNEVLNSKITGEENRYSHTDLSDFEANIRGAKHAFELLEPALKQTDASLAHAIHHRFAAVSDALEGFQGHYAGTGYVNYATVGQDQRRMLSRKVGALAEKLSHVAANVAG